MSYVDLFGKSLYTRADGSGQDGFTFAQFQEFLAKNNASLGGGSEQGITYVNSSGESNKVTFFDNNITSVSPNVLLVGEPTNLSIVGSNFLPETTFYLGDDVTVNSITVTSPTTATVNVTDTSTGTKTITPSLFGDFEGTTAEVDSFGSEVVPGDGTTSWANTVLVTTGNGTIQKNDASASWDASGTFGSVASGVDFVLEFSPGPNLIGTRKVVFGMSDGYVSAIYSDIDYGIYFGVAPHQFSLFENGSWGAPFSTFSATDVFQIRRVGTVVKLHQNDVVIHTYGDASSESELIASASIATNTADLKDISLKTR